MNKVLQKMHAVFQVGSRHKAYTWALGVLDAFLNLPRQEVNELHSSQYNQGYDDYKESIR